MRKSSVVIAGMLVAMFAASFAAYGDETKPTKPGETPQWIGIDEYWFYPLRFEPVTAMNEARFHYRRHEENSAAQKLDEAVSWLKYASDHAMPTTAKKLQTAASDLTTVASDLRAGHIASAAKMDRAMASASTALAEWHYYRAKELYGKNEEGYAAQDLDAAAAHLEDAAISAHYEYGPDTYTLFESIYKDGKWTNTEKKVIDHDVLGRHLDDVEKVIKEMGDTLSKASK